MMRNMQRSTKKGPAEDLIEAEFFVCGRRGRGLREKLCLYTFIFENIAF